ncbi:protein Tob1-like [Physella acuta]|uniref:protein Tob1-like n=1 Tax=Physella acuta TaxID=109671 RepID=UPI0027DD752C|nr:protein Tob1-like [Physella acuta]XP_059144703.1 protein Tob1-like [Physella acuta]
MHVEISVALNFVISYLYNKLPRRRVDLFGEELEIGLKEKFQGHWYPDRPSKGSGYRCVKGNGDEVDPVLVAAALKAGLDIVEVKSYLPEDLTLWIDPSEVSYKIGEKGMVKVLYSDKKDDDGNDNVDKEVQAASRTFNPEAQTFNPEAQTFTPESQVFTPDVLAFTPDVTAFCSDSTQSFQPIDSLSSSLSNLSLSPSSPVPPGSWSTATSPSSNLFNSALNTAMVPPGLLGPRPNSSHRQQFTAAMFAQTKFGSTKLKTQVKRPNRLSPTEFGNYFRQQQRSYAGPQRPRSLSPRDPRVEFLMDQQQRMMMQQQQMSPSHPFGPQFQHQLSPTGVYPEFLRQHSSGISSPHSSPHLSPHMSPHMSPQGNGPAFQDLIQSSPSIASHPSPPVNPISRPNTLSHTGRLSGFPSLNNSMASSASHQGSQMAMFSPDGHKSFVDGLNVAPVNYPNSLQHLLMAN